MPRNFLASNNRIHVAGGNCIGATYGTLACIMRRNQTAVSGVMGLHTAASLSVLTLEIMSNANGNTLSYGVDGTDSESTFTITNADGWVLIVGGKSTGSVAPTLSKYVYGTDTWTHQNGDTARANTADTIATMRWGEWEGVDDFAGDIALSGFWKNRNLSSAERERLPYSLQGWLSLDPTGGWLFDQSDTTQAVLDWTGGGANQNSIACTTVSTNSLPIFTYGYPPIVISTAAGGSTVNGTAVADLGTLTATAAGTPRVNGVAVASFGALTATASGVPTVKGTAVAAFGTLSATVTGKRTVLGAGATSLGALTVTVVGARTATGSAALLGGFTSTAASQRTVNGTASVTSALTSAAVGSRGTTGAGQSAFALTVTITGQRVVYGAATATLGALTATVSGDRTVFGVATANLGGLTAAGSAEGIVTGLAIANLGGLVATANGHPVATGSALANLGALAVSVVGLRTVHGQATAALVFTTAAVGPAGQTPRPVTTATARPSTGSTPRPGTGVTTNPSTKTLRPVTSQTSRP